MAKMVVVTVVITQADIMEKLLEAIDHICEEDDYTGEFGLPSHDKEKMVRIANLINEYSDRKE